MMTHHVMNWNVINISNDQVERIFYYLDGDVPRNFQDMNVVVRDEEDKNEMLSLNVNKPYHKEFYVKFRKPLKPRQKEINPAGIRLGRTRSPLFLPVCYKLRKIQVYFIRPSRIANKSDGSNG